MSLSSIFIYGTAIVLMMSSILFSEQYGDLHHAAMIFFTSMILFFTYLAVDIAGFHEE